MANLNKVMLIGNLTRDPELRYSQGGSPICKLGLATNRKWKNQSGEWQEETCFVDIVVFGRQAETCNEYLAKGRSTFIEGRLNYSSWEDRETGKRRSKLEVVAERVQFLGGRGEGGGGGGYRSSGYESGADRGGGADRSVRVDRSAAPAAKPAAAGGIDFDDIPF